MLLFEFCLALIFVYSILWMIDIVIRSNIREDVHNKPTVIILIVLYVVIEIVHWVDTRKFNSVSRTQ